MRHPYSEALLGAIPKLDAAPHAPLLAIPGAPPDPTRPAPGCAFSPRCRYALARCREAAPALHTAGGVLHTVDELLHQSACWFPLRGQA